MIRYPAHYGGSISGKEDNAKNIEVTQIFRILKKAVVERKVASSETQQNLLEL